MTITIDCSHLISLPVLPGIAQVSKVDPRLLDRIHDLGWSMRHNTQLRKQKKHAAHRRPVRFPGVSGDAKTLGCSRAHLWAVLAGQRTSHSLLRRYRELKSNYTKQP
jgi:hypothetical protein